ncbi:hypothetical protein [Sphingomonas sp. ID0503]|uniref:hypothetical protein n=1 Tax=Sphingomonas sp. ID0503 TaxID=3399691 RepID=UPI003AFA7E55
MNDPRLAAAIDRLGQALGRVEAGLAKLPVPSSTPMVAKAEYDALAARHETLRATVGKAIGRIDALLAEGED